MEAVLVIVSVFASIITGMWLLNWMFKNSEDSTGSMDDFVEAIRPFSFTPWWATKFGMLLIISLGVGMGCYFVLWRLWQWVLSMM